LNGQLVDTGASEAVDLNAFIIQVPIIPYECSGPGILNYEGMALGSTFNAGISATSAAFEIKGASIDLAYGFDAVFQGSFAGGTQVSLRV